MITASAGKIRDPLLRSCLDAIISGAKLKAVGADRIKDQVVRNAVRELAEGSNNVDISKIKDEAVRQTIRDIASRRVGV